MNAMHSKSDANMKAAESYYGAMLRKDFDTMATYLHSNVHFIGPLAEMHGKDAVVSAAKNLSQILQDIHIRSKFAANDQVMLAYDFIFPSSVGILRAAVLMEFTDQLISRIEIFCDGRALVEKKNDIFEGV